MFRWLTISAALVSLTTVTTVGSALSVRASTTAASAPFFEYDDIDGIAATSPTNAWAVGQDSGARMLLAHWNGTNWTRVNSLDADGYLGEISVESPTDAWAVGQDQTPAPGVWFVAHWNGKSWKKDASVPKLAGTPTAVLAVDGDLWVAGTGTVSGKGGKSPVTMLHRTAAGRWYVVPVPASADSALSLAASSRDSIWAVPTYTSPSYLLHWNGSEWKLEATPQWARHDDFMGTAPGPDGSVWVVGYGETGSQVSSFTMRWNGKHWIRAAVPAVKDAELEAVTAVASGTAWAVGSYTANTPNGELSQVLILRWSGKAWTRVKTPTVGIESQLTGAVATSQSNAWAIGEECLGGAEECHDFFDDVLLHWNGKEWT
jgi:hypothetical protein